MEEPESKIPVLAMLKTQEDQLKTKAQRLLEKLKDFSEIEAGIKMDVSAVGGGALPTAELPTYCVFLSHKSIELKELEKRLRVKPKVPVICRIKDDKLLLDMRTIRDNELEIVVQSIKEAIS